MAPTLTQPPPPQRPTLPVLLALPPLPTLLALLALPPAASAAETLSLIPDADSSLIEIAPTNNFGGMPFFNAGTTQVGTRNRGLLRFNPAPALPRGARILTAELTLEVVGIPADGFAEGVFQLHRVLQPWTEGSQVSPDPEHPGFGHPAAPGETTWLDRHHGQTAPWTLPGGQPGTDFLLAPSSEQTIYGLPDSPYTFASTPQLVDDVQLWLDRPDANFGWILLPRDESTRFTARRFASREDPDLAPLLTLTFLSPPRFVTLKCLDATCRLLLELPPGPPVLLLAQDRLDPAAPWQALQEFPARDQTQFPTHDDPLTPGERYYRLATRP